MKYLYQVSQDQLDYDLYVWIIISFQSIINLRIGDRFIIILLLTFELKWVWVYLQSKIYGIRMVTMYIKIGIWWFTKVLNRLVG